MRPQKPAYTLLHTLTSATTNYTRSGYLPTLSPILLGNLVLCFRAPVNSENLGWLYLWTKKIREEQPPETEKMAALVSSGFSLSGSRPLKGPGDVPVFLEHPCFLWEIPPLSLSWLRLLLLTFKMVLMKTWALTCPSYKNIKITQNSK